ncbi:MAG TPA: phospholipase D-like domain-containing protein [Caldimonas sp.]|nr:phospholipase D-like domain-containing protein [Caldimonas sp.]
MKLASRAVWARCLILLCTLAIGGCSTMPMMVPDMAQTRHAVRIEAPNGKLLSPEQSKALIERLQGPGRSTTVLERHLAVEEAIAGYPLTAGNAVELLEDGPATYAAMFAAIRAARDTVDMETYILEDDEIGRRFADALLDAQRRGVQVALIHDGVGTLGTPREYWDRLKAGGVKVLEFNPINPLTAKAGWDVNQRDHRKLLVVDGATAFLGGINISGVYSGSSRPGSASHGSGSRGDDKHKVPWRDTDVRIAGPVVADLQKLFLDTWQRQKGDPLPDRDYFPTIGAQGPSVVRAIGSGPEDPYNLLYATFLSAINSAEGEILITNAYFDPDPQLQEALIAAVKRGVDVKLIVPSTTDSSLVFHAGRSHYEALLEGGVKLYERKAALLHAKTALIDGVWATVGSTNLDWRSFLHNQEVNAVVLGTDFGALMRASFDRDLADSRAITLEEWRHRPFSDRIKEAFSRLWEYWL